MNAPDEMRQLHKQFYGYIKSRIEIEILTWRDKKYEKNIGTVTLINLKEQNLLPGTIGIKLSYKAVIAAMAPNITPGKFATTIGQSFFFWKKP